MTIQRGVKVCVWKTDSPDDGRIGVVTHISLWYGEPVATVQFLEAEWDQSDHDYFYVADLIRV